MNVEVELIRGYDNTGAIEYRGMTSVGQFGFFMSLSGAANALSIGRSTADSSTNWGSGSIMGIRTRWQDSTDTVGATSVIVPQTEVLTLAAHQTETAASTDFADFQARIAAL